MEEFEIKNKENRIEEVDFLELSRKKYFIDVNKKIERPPIALSKGFHYYGTTSYETPICTYSNFSAISGPSKSMKTLLKSALLAGYIGGQSNNYFEDLKGHDNEKKWVIDIDTEQSAFHVQSSANRVLKMVGNNHPYYLPFMLREADFSERMGFIDWIFTKSPWRENIGFVAIDGVADLISDTNSLEQSNLATNNLLRWSAISKAHILTVIHNRYDSNKPTGHVGSSITKKAETVFKTTMNEGEVMVSPLYTRNEPFTDFSFKRDSDNLPKEITNGY